jgi:hypothetical protein
MTYPLVRDLAAEKIPVAVTCRVLRFSKQGYFKWRTSPAARGIWSTPTNAVVDIHHDDPVFGYRFIADELHRLGYTASENRVWRLCSAQRLWSAQAKKRGIRRLPGPPVHDDLVRRDWSASGTNVLWFTEHPTMEGKLYCCAVKDAFSNRVVGYATDARRTALRAGPLPSASARCTMPSRSAAPARRSCIQIAVRSSVPTPTSTRSRCSGSRDRWAESLPAWTTLPWSPSSRSCRRTFSTREGGRRASSCTWRSSRRSSAPITAVVVSALSGS